MASPIKKNTCLISPGRKESDPVFDSGDSNSTLTDEEVMDEEIFSNYVGVELIYFEHSYMKNYVALNENLKMPNPDEEKLPEEGKLSEAGKVEESEKLADSVKLAETGKLVESENVAEAGKITEPEKIVKVGYLLEPDKLPESDKILASQKTPESDKILVSQETPESDKALASGKTPESDKVLASQKTPESEKVLASRKTPESDKVLAPQKTTQFKKLLVLGKLPKAKKLTESGKLFEAEKSLEAKISIEAEKLSEVEKSSKSEKLFDITEHSEKSSIRVPIRRSLRHLSKFEKDKVANISGISNSDHLLDNKNVCIEENKESIDTIDNKVLNSTVVCKNKTDSNGEAIVSNVDDIPSKNEYLLQSPSGKNIKRLKFSEVKVVLEKDFNIDLLKTTAKGFITVGNGECKEKDDVTLTRPKRKRTYSEPSLSSSEVESVDKEKLKSKKIKSLAKSKSSTKTKLSEKLTASDNVQKRKRNLSAPSDKSLKEEISKNSKKNLESSIKGKRKKCLSLSEDLAPNELAKSESKKNAFSENKSVVEMIELCSAANAAAKQKHKKSRKDSLRFIINEDEPALFSQPDVMVKVKTDDGTKKEIKPAFEDKIVPHVKSSDNLSSELIGNVPKPDLSDSIAQEIPTQSPSLVSAVPLNEPVDKANELVSGPSSEKYVSKDIDSENSLQIDESMGDIFEEEKIQNPGELDNNVPNISVEKPDINEINNIKDTKNDDINMLNSNEPKVLKTNVEDLDCDKPIAERKPRRIIKKKEFFEDITSRSSTPTKKSVGKQRGVDKKGTKEEAKQSKRKSASKSEVESEESEEDDPTKLWCICRQPHNDRFMIMCDRCEDWFHGNCVGITRQQGRKLEKLQKEWMCPNCQEKGSDAATAETSTLKKVETEEKVVKTEKTVSEFEDNATKSIQPSKKEKVVEKTTKLQLKTTQNKQSSSTLNSSSNLASNLKSEKGAAPNPTNKKCFNKNNLNTSKVTESASNNKKGLKEPIRRKQHCVSCQGIVSSGTSCYCSDKCLEKHATDCLTVMRTGKEALKGSEFDSQKVVVLDQVKGNVIAGDNAPSAGNIISWLKANPSYMIACSSSPSSSSKTVSQKKETDSTSSSKDKNEANEEAKAKVRLNVRKTLKNILLERCKFGGDIQMSEEDIRKITNKIEEELHFLFKDNSFKYRAKYRSLMFNIKDPRNQGLYRKILKGSIPPGKLVRMSPEELASVELAKWREKENQHSLDMIKRVQLEQQSATGLLLKKTHKGEVEIEDDFSVIDDIPKTSSKPLSGEPPEVEKPEPDKEIMKDTTPQHRSHLFDLNCKICTGKVIPPPVDDNTPKKVRVAHSISVDLSSPTTIDHVEKNVSRIVDGKSPVSSTGDDSLDQEPTSTVSIGSPETCLRNPDFTTQRDVSIWKGSIVMQDVTRIDAFAFKVSGDTESFNMYVSGVLDVCGRIIPDQVWDYLGKIKQSGNKELVITRFKPVDGNDIAAYENFFSYLSIRRRYGVVYVDKHFSKKIKDFYILPLASTSPVPVVLMPFDGPGLPTPRTNLLLGVIVRHKINSCILERRPVNPPVFRKEKSKEVEKSDGSYTPPLETRSYTPPLPVHQTDSSPSVTSSNNSPSVTTDSSPISVIKEIGMYSPSMAGKNIAASVHIPTTSAHGNPITIDSEVEMYSPSMTSRNVETVMLTPVTSSSSTQSIVTADSSSSAVITDDSPSIMNSDNSPSVTTADSSPVSIVSEIGSMYSPSLPSQNATTGYSSSKPMKTSSNYVYDPSKSFKNTITDMYRSSKLLKNTASPEESDATHTSPSEDLRNEMNSEIYEPSYTPPLQIPKEKEDEKPYDPEQDILNINADSAGPKINEQHTFNLEKKKEFIDAIKKELAETNQKLNAFKQFMSQPNKYDSEYQSPSNQTLDINSVAATGMSSFLDLPQNLQDILNNVREKSFDKDKLASKGDVDMRINNLFRNSNYQTANESDKLINLQDRNNSPSLTPPLDENDENSSSLARPSDPRIKIRTSFQESFSEEPANVSLSNMSVSELVEKAEKELAEDDVEEETENISPIQKKLVTSEIDTLPPTCWSEFKEPPPPGIELSELISSDSAYSSKTISSPSESSLPSTFSSPLVQEAPQISPCFPPPSIPPAFPPLPPGFSIQTPPPNLKNFPPPNVLSTSFPLHPSLPVVTKASDINIVSDTWPSWNISPQQSKNSTWQNRVPQWDENWKNATETALVDCVESSSHYYPPGASEFHKESFYRGESSAESRWNRPRFGRNNWHKRPSRGGNWRGRRGSFYFNKNQRNG